MIMITMERSMGRRSLFALVMISMMILSTSKITAKIRNVKKKDTDLLEVKKN